MDVQQLGSSLVHFKQMRIKKKNNNLYFCSAKTSCIASSSNIFTDYVAGTPSLIETKMFLLKRTLQATVWGSSCPARIVTLVTYTLQLVTTTMYTLRSKGKTLSQWNITVERNFLTIDHAWPQGRFDKVTYKRSAARGQIEPVLLRAVGLQLGTLPADRDTSHGNACRLRALIF